jgi:hypothetical protein
VSMTHRGVRTSASWAQPVRLGARSFSTTGPRGSPESAAQSAIGGDPHLGAPASDRSERSVCVGSHCRRLEPRWSLLIGAGFQNEALPKNRIG